MPACWSRFDGASRLVGDATMRMVRLRSGVQEDLAERMRGAQMHREAEGGAAAAAGCRRRLAQGAVLLLFGDRGGGRGAGEEGGLVEQYDQEMLRAPHEGVTEQPEIRSVPLNTEQQRVYDGLAALYGSHKPAGARCTA